MKDWIISVVIAVFMFNVLGMLLPENNLSKYIKKIFSILLIFVVVQPIFDIKKSELNFSEFNSLDQQTLQEEYLDFITNKKIENYKENCLTILKNHEIKSAEIEIIYNITENHEIIVNYVEINLRNSGINSDKGHIDIIESIKTSISTYLNIEKDKVCIYV